MEKFLTLEGLPGKRGKKNNTRLGTGYGGVTDAYWNQWGYLWTGSGDPRSGGPVSVDQMNAWNAAIAQAQKASAYKAAGALVTAPGANPNPFAWVDPNAQRRSSRYGMLEGLSDYYSPTDVNPASAAAATGRPDLFTRATASVVPGHGVPSLFDYFYTQHQDVGLHGVGERAVALMSVNGVRVPRNLSSEDLESLGRATMLNLLGTQVEGCYDDGTLGGWLSRAFTPPAAIRRMVKPSKAMSKVLRYAGAAAFTAAMPFGIGLVMGKQRNKIFGLKGHEQKAFDAAAKVGRIAAVAVVTVAGGAAIMAAMSPAAAAGAAPLLTPAATGAAAFAPETVAFAGTGIVAPTAFTSVATAGTGAAASTGFFAGAQSFLQSAIGSKVGSFIIKDIGKEMVMKITSDAVGRLTGSAYSKDQIPPETYDALPPNVPVPAPSYAGGDMAPMVAGTGSMEPNSNISPAPETNDYNAFNQTDVEDNAPQRAEDVLDKKDTEAVDAQLSPSREEKLRALVDQTSDDDQLSLKDIIANAKAKPETVEAEMLDGEPSLKATAAYIRRQRAAALGAAMPAMRPAPRAVKGRPMASNSLPFTSPLSIAAQKARLARLYRIVHE